MIIVSSSFMNKLIKCWSSSQNIHNRYALMTYRTNRCLWWGIWLWSNQEGSDASILSDIYIINQNHDINLFLHISLWMELHMYEFMCMCSSVLWFTSKASSKPNNFSTADSSSVDTRPFRIISRYLAYVYCHQASEDQRVFYVCIWKCAAVKHYLAKVVCH